MDSASGISLPGTETTEGQSVNGSQLEGNGKQTEEVQELLHFVHLLKFQLAQVLNIDLLDWYMDHLNIKLNLTHFFSQLLLI